MKVNFCHRYHKLNHDRFTTVRGKSWFKGLKVGQIVSCHAPGEKDFECRVLAAELRVIKELGLPFLKADAEYQGFEIENSLQFISLLNSFRKWPSQKLCAEDEVTVLTLERTTLNKFV